jgi:hypothetical protein
MTTNQIVHLSDDALIDAIARAAATEREATACLLRLIMEVDRRRLYLGRGFPSMFAYCTRALRFSEQAAYSRIIAARAARRFPRLLDELAAGELTLSSVGLLAPHLTDENVEMLMEGARGRSTREVERMIAGLHAQPDIPATVRALPEPKAEAPVPAAGAPAPRPAEPSLRLYGGLFGRATPADAPSTAPTADAVKPPSWNSITWSHSLPAEGRPPTTSNSAAARTTHTRRCSSLVRIGRIKHA